MDDIVKNTLVKISQELDLPIAENADNQETQIVILIEERVAELLENQPELLMSYLYRLDVEEKKLNDCLSPNGDKEPYKCIANLIWERQKKRMETKMKYKPKDSIEKGWEW